MYKRQVNEIEQAIEAARRSEVVIVVVGGSSARDFKTSYKETGAAVAEEGSVSDMECGEGFDRASLSLLCLLYTSNQLPPKETEPYVDYFVRQCYTTGSAQSLQSKFDQLSSWCPPEKFVATEQMGWYRCV